LISEAIPPVDGAASTSTVVAARPRFTHLVAMHPGEGGPKLPFFLVAGMFGNVLNLRHLAHLVGADRPFYGVQARGLFGGDVPHEDFVEMATDYLKEVRSVQPHGPYLLGGFSGGGITAFEMAQQLRAEGEEVGLLVLLDTATAFNPPLRVTERVHIQLDNVRDRGPAYIRDWAVNRVQWEREKRRRRGDGDAETSDGALHSTAIEAAFYRALERYDTKPYDGVITLYRPALSPLHVFGPDRQINIDRRFIYDDNGWGPFCQRIDVTEVPGDHSGMVLEPNVRVLAGHLRAQLDAVEPVGAPQGLE
jgi:thioesterase domain-containing protein